MSRHIPKLPAAFDPHWSADQFAVAADRRLRLDALQLACFAPMPCANRAPASRAPRPLQGGYAPQPALALFRVGG